MTDNLTTKDAILPELERAWSQLQTVIHDVEMRGHSELTDDAGWTATDHLSHIAVWMKSVIGMVRSGRAQWEGLGIERELFESGDYDAMNEDIRRQHSNWSSEHIIQQLNDEYREFQQVLDGLTDKDLSQPGFAYAEGGGDDPIVNKLVGNSLAHFDEHRPWIEAILARDEQG